MTNNKETVDFNINNYILVKLTKSGLKELEQQHNQLKEVSPNIGDYNPPETNDEGYSKWQAWELFSKLGYMLDDFKVCPFDTNIKIVL